MNDLPVDRPGIRTTEFWLALIVAIGGMAAATWSTNPVAQVAGMISAALSSMGYGISRASSKKAGAL